MASPFSMTPDTGFVKPQTLADRPTFQQNFNSAYQDIAKQKMLSELPAQIDQLARDPVYGDRARIIASYAQYNPDKAIAELMDIKKEKGSNNVAAAAYLQKYQTAKAAYDSEFSKPNKDPDLLAKYKMEAYDAEKSYYELTGKRLDTSGFTTSSNTAANQAKSIADAEKAQYETKTMKSAEANKAVTMINEQVEKLYARKQKFIEGLSALNKSQAMLSGISETNAPEQLFAATKALAQIIEPGMAVTEGEVKGFLGSNKVTETMQMAVSVIAALKSLTSTASTEEAMYAAGKGSAKGVTQIKSLASSLASKLSTYWSTVTNAGVDAFSQNVAKDIQDIYGVSIDEPLLQSIKGRINEKINAAFPDTNPSTTATSESQSGRMTALEPKNNEDETVKISPSLQNAWDNISKQPYDNDIYGDAQTAAEEKFIQDQVYALNKAVVQEDISAARKQNFLNKAKELKAIAPQYAEYMMGDAFMSAPQSHAVPNEPRPPFNKKPKPKNRVPSSPTTIRNGVKYRKDKNGNWEKVK